MKLEAALLVSLLLASGCASSTSSPVSPTGTGQVLVTFHPAPENVQLHHLRGLATTYGLRPVAAWTMESLGELCAVFDAPGQTAMALSARLRSHPGVSSAQPVHRFRTLETPGFDDPYYELQYGIREVPLASIHEHARGDRVRIALVDTGVDVSHPDLGGRIVLAANLAPATPDSFTEDRHGTALAGIIAAQTNNGLGIVGIAPGAELLALKACWYESDGADVAVCDSYTLARALDMALTEDVDLINLSLTGPRDSLLSRLLDMAAERRIPVVAAVDGGVRDGGFPANRPEVLGARAAVVPGRELHPLRDPDAALWLAGPAVDILTTAPRGGYDFYTGSSYAAAYVTGVIALLLSQRPGLPLDEIRARLRDASSRTLDPCLLLYADPEPVCPEG